MKRPATVCLLLIASCGCPSAGYAQWVSIGDGIEYQDFTASGPNRLFVSRMTRSNTNTTIDTTIANNTISGAKEIVRNQAARQDDALTWWGGSWGARNDVVVAINGGFYNTTTGVIDGGQIQSGWYSHWFADSFSGFAWRTNRTPFVGQCVVHQAAKVYVKFVSNSATEVIDGINRDPGANDLVLFTPQYNNQTPSGTRTEVLVEMTKPIITTSGSGYASGTIRSKATNTGSTWIPFDHIVLSADGGEGTTLNTNSTVGAEVRIFQELLDKNEPDVQGNSACQTTTGQDWSNTFASINVNYHFLENNVVRVPDAVTHPGYIGYVNLNPRTAICYNSTHVFFVICDGRSAQSIGMSCETLGNWAKSVLGATDGVNLDGGGSSTMVVNGNVMNVPSDGSERAVCNGVVMVNLAAKQQSTQFTVGQTVYTVGSANMRLGPGTNYGNRSTIASGAQGTIVDHSLKGVYAKGFYWWKCSFGGTIGWVAQSLLTATPGSQPPNITQHPSNQTVSPGGTAVFTVAAVGDGTLNYQWQKNLSNLSNGGHYSGCTTTSLTISSCDGNDVASYRCVVTSTFGSDTSNAATLTLGQPSSVFIVESRLGGQNYANYSETGTWSDATCKSTAAQATSGIGSRFCIIGSSPATAVFAFTPSTAGTYEIFTTNCNTSNSGDPLVHRVTHAGGTSSVNVCQNSTCASNTINQWFSLGQYTLNAVTPYTVTLDGSTTGGSAPSGNAGRSDAIRWELLGGAPQAPTITQHPSNQSTTPGGSAAFTVTASGTAPLSYQWQKNQSDLSNGGHYSGVTTETLTITNADNNDVANYRCVVTNSLGSATSNEAALAVAACSSPTLLNGNFEGGNTGGVATSWTGYQRPPNPTTVWSIQTASPPTGGGLQYQQIANTSSTGGGGVYQIVTGCTSGATYTIAGWMRTNSASATCTVRCSPSASTNWSSAVDLDPPQTTTSASWVPFSGTVIAAGASMTIWLDGQTGGSGLNKASCFDSVTVTGCSTPSGPTITQHPGTQNVCAGNNATFTVAATGNGTLAYQWQKNSSNLSNGGHYSGVSTTTLTVSSTDAGDVATYRCVVSDSGGSTNSNAASLTLKTATAISQHPLPQSISSGGTANFGVSATGDGTLTFQWQKNSVDLTNGGHYSGVTTSSLTVSSADGSDAANYRCVVTGGCGSATSNQAALTVGAASIPGDFDHDQDVDQADFAHLQNCFDPLAGPVLDPNCADANLDNDAVGHIDQTDLGVFLRCMTGPGVAGNPNCAN